MQVGWQSDRQRDEMNECKENIINKREISGARDKNNGNGKAKTVKRQDNMGNAIEGNLMQEGGWRNCV